MKCIDFDKRFAQYLQGWIQENAGKYKNADEMEAETPDLYLNWIHQPADWLDGLAPADYFSTFEDAKQLVDWMLLYQKRRVPVPDQLYERIVDLGAASVPHLIALADDESAFAAARIAALNMLTEIDCPVPVDLCVRLMVAPYQKQELIEAASDLLSHAGTEAVEPLLARVDTLQDDALACCLDLLCNFPGDERIYSYVLAAFLADEDRRALYASYLGKLGDARAIEPLKKALLLSEITYLDSIEIVHAIEALGGEATCDRDFAGDPFYESLKHTQ